MKEQDSSTIENKIEFDREVFTTGEAAKFLRTSTVTLWRERKAGKISFRRVASKIVYLKSDLEDYLKSQKRGGFSV